MSDTSQGPGWWQASDAKWYPPEQHPDAAATPAPVAEPTPPVPAPVPPEPVAESPEAPPLPAPEVPDRPLPPGATQVIQRPAVPPTPDPAPVTPTSVPPEPSPSPAPAAAAAPPAPQAPPPEAPSYAPAAATTPGAPAYPAPGPSDPMPGAPIPGGSFGGAPAPAKKKGGAGKIILILILLVVLVAIIGAVVYFLAFRNSTPNAADVANTTGIRSANVTSANPPQYDLNLPKEGGGGSLVCNAAGGKLVSSSTLTNKSGSAADYDVVVEFRQDGKTVGSATAKVNNVGNGATADWTATTTAPINGQFSCKVVEVDRRQAGTQTLS